RPAQLTPSRPWRAMGWGAALPWRCGGWRAAIPGVVPALIRCRRPLRPINPTGKRILMSENKNLILAFVISLVILLGYDLLFMRPKMEAERARQAAQSEVAATPPAAAVGDLPSVRETATPASREDVIK